MFDFKIGIIIDSFKLGVRDGIKKAKELGAQGIQIYTTEGELSPENLSSSKRKELLDMVTSNGLVISALCGDLGGHGFIDEKDNEWKIDKSKRIMDLAKDLNTDVITTHIGVVPEDKKNKRYDVMGEACEKLGSYGDSVGAIFAIETGPERAVILKGFLDDLDSNGVRVNLDPANLVMVTGDDPAEAVFQLKDYIVHTHAKDGVMLLKKSPEIIYGMIEEEIKTGSAFLEVPLGEGSVDFMKYLKALDDIGYEGFLTIEREVGEDPEKDIKLAIAFLHDTIRKLKTGN